MTTSAPAPASLLLALVALATPPSVVGGVVAVVVVVVFMVAVGENAAAEEWDVTRDMVPSVSDVALLPKVRSRTLSCPPKLLKGVSLRSMASISASIVGVVCHNTQRQELSSPRTHHHNNNNTLTRLPPELEASGFAGESEKPPRVLYTGGGDAMRETKTMMRDGGES